MKNSLWIFLFFVISKSLFAQDTITTSSGEKMLVKLVRFSNYDIKYRLLNERKHLHFISLTKVASVAFENTNMLTPVSDTGYFSSEQSNEPGQVEKTFFKKGEQDASRYYRKYVSAGTGTFVISLASPLAGLIPAIGFSVTDPAVSRLTFPDPGLMSRNDYREGYLTKARKIKKARVWSNWSVALGINVFALLALKLAN